MVSGGDRASRGVWTPGQGHLELLVVVDVQGDRAWSDWDARDGSLAELMLQVLHGLVHHFLGKLDLGGAIAHGTG